MPAIVLPFRAPDGSGTGIYQWSVLAVMLFPRIEDEDRRLQWEATAYARSYVDAASLGASVEDMAAFHKWIPHLWELRQAPSVEFSTGLERLKRAHFSGEILAVLLTCARHYPRHFKVERARALVSHLNEGSPVPSSESTLTKVWAEFRTVSHLWAAFPFEDLSVLGVDAQAGETVQWLVEAEAFRRSAENAGVLKPGEAWSLPVDSETPTTDLDQYLERLPEDLLAWLDQEFPK